MRSAGGIQFGYPNTRHCDLRDEGPHCGFQHHQVAAVAGGCETNHLPRQRLCQRHNDIARVHHNPRLAQAVGRDDVAVLPQLRVQRRHHVRHEQRAVDGARIADPVRTRVGLTQQRAGRIQNCRPVPVRSGVKPSGSGRDHGHIFSSFYARNACRGINVGIHRELTRLMARSHRLRSYQHVFAANGEEPAQHFAEHGHRGRALRKTVAERHELRIGLHRVDQPNDPFREQIRQRHRRNDNQHARNLLYQIPLLLHRAGDRQFRGGGEAAAAVGRRVPQRRVKTRRLHIPGGACKEMCNLQSVFHETLQQGHVGLGEQARRDAVRKTVNNHLGAQQERADERANFPDSFNQQIRQRDRSRAGFAYKSREDFGAVDLHRRRSGGQIDTQSFADQLNRLRDKEHESAELLSHGSQHLAQNIAAVGRGRRRHLSRAVAALVEHVVHHVEHDARTRELRTHGQIGVCHAAAEIRENALQFVHRQFVLYGVGEVRQRRHHDWTENVVAAPPNSHHDGIVKQLVEERNKGDAQIGRMETTAHVENQFAASVDVGINRNRAEQAHTRFRKLLIERPQCVAPAAPAHVGDKRECLDLHLCELQRTGHVC